MTRIGVERRDTEIRRGLRCAVTICVDTRHFLNNDIAGNNSDRIEDCVVGGVGICHSTVGGRKRRRECNVPDLAETKRRSGRCLHAGKNLYRLARRNATRNAADIGDERIGGIEYAIAICIIVQIRCEPRAKRIRSADCHCAAGDRHVPEVRDGMRDGNHTARCCLHLLIALDCEVDHLFNNHSILDGIRRTV